MSFGSQDIQLNWNNHIASSINSIFSGYSYLTFAQYCVEAVGKDGMRKGVLSFSTFDCGVGTTTSTLAMTMTNSGDFSWQQEMAGILK